MELQELANKLFMFTDARDWDKLLSQVFTENVWFDMESAGGGAAKSVAATNICRMWKEGFEGLDAMAMPWLRIIKRLLPGEKQECLWAVMILEPPGRPKAGDSAALSIS